MAPPGQRFVYSDINYIAARRNRRAGSPADRSTPSSRERILEPLGMRDTMFLPPASLAERASRRPTCGSLRGVVHDPTARRMGGVAGHAGLFGTADDLARFCRMMIGGGVARRMRVLSPLTVARMTAPATPSGEPNVRGLGWDIDSSYLQQSRRVPAARVLRPHRVHRHVDLDRSGDALFIIFLYQPRTP